MAQTANEIKTLVDKEISTRITDYSQQKDIRQHLIEPVKVSYKNSFKQDEQMTLWLVYKDSDTPNSYQIVYNDSENQFGLALNKVFLGYHGSFSDTLDAM